MALVVHLTLCPGHYEGLTSLLFLALEVLCIFLGEFQIFLRYDLCGHPFLYIGLVVIATVQSGGHWSASPDLPLRRRPLTTLSHLDSQWGEPRSEAAFGTGARVAGSSVIVAGPAASSGQPLVLAVLEAVNPDLAPVSGWRRGTRRQGGSGKPIVCRVLAVERCSQC